MPAMPPATPCLKSAILNYYHYYQISQLFFIQIIIINYPWKEFARISIRNFQGNFFMMFGRLQNQNQHIFARILSLRISKLFNLQGRFP